MSPQNNSRASELGAILTSGASGFTVRKRTGIGLFFHFFLLACLVIMGASLLVYYQSPTGCLLAVAIGLSFVIVAHNLEKSKKVKESLEFMNALFSSSVGKGYKFCCIIKSTGDIVFYNRPFQSIFPAYIAQNTRTLSMLLGLYHVPQADREKITSLMATNTEGTFTTSIRQGGEAGETQSLSFQLETIERPTGFFLLRGK